MRDIVRKVDEEINAVRRELAHMENAGMVSKEQRANRLFYSFRKDYPLYFELLELIGKTSGLGADIIKQRAKLGKLKYVMVSGRYLRGLAKKSQTDVDLLSCRECRIFRNFHRLSKPKKPDVSGK